MPEALRDGEPDDQSAGTLSPAQAGLLLAWVNHLSRRRASLTEQLQRQVRALTVALGRGRGLYSDRQVAQYAEQVADLVRGGQLTVVGLEQAYLDRVLAEFAIDPAGDDVELPDSLRGVDPLEEWERPAEQMRFALSQGRSLDEAVTAGTNRAEQLVDGDIGLAARETVRQRLAPVDRIFGYRRITFPERSESGTCGLCIAAADRKYYVADLLPIHLRCKCEVLPLVVGRPDPGRLNPSYAQVLQANQGRTDRATLKKVRYQLHGELGPVLVVDGQQWNGDSSAAPAA